MRPEGYWVCCREPTTCHYSLPEKSGLSMGHVWEIIQVGMFAKSMEQSFLEVNSNAAIIIKKFPSFYETRRLLSVLPRAHNLALSSTGEIRSIPSQPTSFKSIWISSHLCVGLQSGLLPYSLHTKTFSVPDVPPIPSPSFNHRDNLIF